MTIIDQLIAVTNQYAEARGLSLARVSTLVFNDGSKIGDLVNGDVDLVTRRFERAMQWFSDNWPDGADWPPQVKRPEPKETPKAISAAAAE